MLIDCSYCKAKVDSEVLKDYVCPQSEEEPFPFKISLVKCPICKQGLLVVQDKEYRSLTSKEVIWGSPDRLWPDPKKYLDWSLPGLVRISLEEAELCLNAKAYFACAVMCGRAVEAICNHYEVKAKTLEKGLKELLEKRIIDKRIYEWSEVLRVHRNIGAHPNEEKISEEDAKDLLDFTKAICDYVFVLTKKFEDFIKRKDKKAEKKKKQKTD